MKRSEVYFVFALLFYVVYNTEVKQSCRIPELIIALVFMLMYVITGMKNNE